MVNIICYIWFTNGHSGLWSDPHQSRQGLYPLYTFIAVYTPMYTRYTCIYTTCTPNAPLNTLKTPSKHPIYALNTAGLVLINHGKAPISASTWETMKTDTFLYVNHYNIYLLTIIIYNIYDEDRHLFLYVEESHMIQYWVRARLACTSTLRNEQFTVFTLRPDTMTLRTLIYFLILLITL